MANANEDAPQSGEKVSWEDQAAEAVDEVITPHEWGDASGEIVDGAVDEVEADLVDLIREARGLDTADDADVDPDDDIDPDGEDRAPPAAEALHKVRVGGEEVEVTYEELVRGYSRQTDYTRKTQELAAERRQIEQRAELTDQAAQAYAARLEQIAGFMQQHLTAEQLQHIEREYAQVRQAQERTQAERLARHVETEKQLLEAAIPEWSNPETAANEKAQLRTYAHSMGFTDQDLANVQDHRALLLLRKAQLYDQLIAKGAEVRDRVRERANHTRVLQPGGRMPSEPTEKRRYREGRQRLRQSGRVDDAVGLIAGLID